MIFFADIFTVTVGQWSTNLNQEHINWSNTATAVDANGYKEIINVKSGKYEGSASVFDAKGLIIMPGFIDAHVHGSMNIDFMDASLDDYKTVSESMYKEGVTTFLATTLTSDKESLLKVARTVKEAVKEVENLGGIHLEGPYINTKYLKEFKNKEAYYIECNHDIEMLTHGPYPEWLKARVLSDVGHLSNKFCGMYLSKMIGDNTKYITLLHLSEKNNCEEVALNTVSEILEERLNNIKMVCAKPNECGEVIKLWLELLHLVKLKKNI